MAYSVDKSYEPRTRVRRNGLAASCENCRKSKISCSHGLPCQRCARDDKECYYHPSPMSRGGEGILATNVEGRASAHQSTDESVLEGDLAPGKRSFTAFADKSPLESISRVSYRMQSPRYEPGYYGITATSAVLLEHKNLVGEDVWNEIVRKPNAAQIWRDPVGKATCCGAAILSALPTQEVCEAVLKRYFEMSLVTTTVVPLVRTFLRRFWETFGALLAQPRNKENLLKASQTICRNTAERQSFFGEGIPLSTTQWVDSCCGQKTRWDMVGIIFVILGFVSNTWPKNNAVTGFLLKDSTPRQAGVKYLELSNACAMLCDELDEPSNILALLLLYKTAVLESVIDGDSGPALWKKVGSVTAALSTLGLHRNKTPEPPFSLLFVELQKRLKVYIFGLSEVLAAFHGRPPCMSRHYICGEDIVDAADEKLMEDDLAQIQEDLSVDGWSTHGGVYPSTMARVYLKIHLVRDEILELSLGNRPTAEALKTRVDDVRQRINIDYASLPPHLKIKLTREFARNATREQVYSLANIRLHFLHNEYLLERIDYPSKDPSSQVYLAATILDLVILIWSERETYPEQRDFVHWFITCYGISSASTLAIDLYRNSNQPNTHPYTRSQTVQNLSLFVAALEWVTVDDGNYVLCQKVRQLLKLILDLVLAPPSIPDYTMDQTFSGFDLNDVSVADVPMFGADFEEWFSVEQNSRGTRMTFA